MSGWTGVNGGNAVMPDPKSGVHRVLVTRMKFIGDIVLSTAIVQDLRQALPEAYIAYLGDSNAVSLLEGNPCLDEIIPYDFSRPALAEQVRVAALLRRRRFDVVLDLFGNPRSALLSYLSGAPVRVGLDRPGRGRLYTVRVSDDGKPKTAISFHRQFLHAIGIPSGTAMPALYLKESERRDVRDAMIASICTTDNGPLVVFHVGATWPSKQWGEERFAELAVILRRTVNATIVVTGGPSDTRTVEAVAREAGTVVHPFDSMPLRKLASLLAVSDVVVANDGGPMHIAAAVGTPTVGIFGPGQEDIWFPYNADDGHAALRKDVPCHPCHLNVCNRDGDGKMECMKLLSADDVRKAVERALQVRRGISKH